MHMIASIAIEMSDVTNTARAVIAYRIQMAVCVRVVQFLLSHTDFRIEFILSFETAQFDLCQTVLTLTDAIQFKQEAR